MLKQVIPPIVYSTLFLASGVLILVIGASVYIDQLLGIQGAGLMIGGVVLILLGMYFKSQLNRSIELIDSMI